MSVTPQGNKFLFGNLSSQMDSADDTGVNASPDVTKISDSQVSTVSFIPWHESREMVWVASGVFGVTVVFVVAGLVCLMRYNRKCLRKNVPQGEMTVAYAADKRSTYYHQDSMISVPETVASSPTQSMNQENQFFSVPRSAGRPRSSSSSLKKLGLDKYYEMDTCQEVESETESSAEPSSATNKLPNEKSQPDDIFAVENHHYYF